MSVWYSCILVWLLIFFDVHMFLSSGKAAPASLILVLMVFVFVPVSVIVSLDIQSLHLVMSVVVVVYIDAKVTFSHAYDLYLLFWQC